MKPPEGYYILVPEDIIEEGDVYWSLTENTWEDTKDGGYNYQVRSSSLTYARKKMNIRQQIEEKEKQLKELVEIENQQMLRDAADEGFIKGAILGNGEAIKNVAVVRGIEHAKTFSSSAADYWRQHKKSFVVVEYGAYFSAPMAELSIKKAPALPDINGHMGRYVKDSKTITYGCAVLYIHELKYYAGGPSVYPGEVNRRVMSVKLCSDVNITLEQLSAIMQHVNYINKNDAKG